MVVRMTLNDCRFSSPACEITCENKHATPGVAPKTFDARGAGCANLKGLDLLDLRCCESSSTPKASAFRLASVAFASEMACPSRFPHKGHRGPSSHVGEIVRPGTIYVSTGQIGTADERAQDGEEVSTVLLFAWLDM